MKMLRDLTTSAKIAILATGDEICRGDILNSNSQEIALRLTQHDMPVGLHLTAPDSVESIELALRFLLNTHTAVIMTGGLGPTSDDLTRYALSNVIAQPLQFDAATWQATCRYLHEAGILTPPEGNRQQALFPVGATIFPNVNGTAAGCVALWQDCMIFMLPGPPSECLPMLQDAVIPRLMQAGYQRTLYYHHWLLLGASEGKIAEEIDALAQSYDCVTGYRIAYPYVEVKLHSRHKADFHTLTQQLYPILQPYLIEDGQQFASSLLREKLIQQRVYCNIIDTATGGLLEVTLQTPELKEYVVFAPATPDHTCLQIAVTGIVSYWQQDFTQPQTPLILTLTRSGAAATTVTVDIPLRRPANRTRLYAVEMSCKTILEFLAMPAPAR